MKSLVCLLGLGFTFLLFSCNKEEIKPKNEIFIRVKNTSLVDYLNVSIYSGTNQNELQPKQINLIKPGTYSDYLDFESVADPVGYYIRLNEYLSIGTFSFDPTNTKRLEKGKYTLELYVPNRGQLNVETKLIKEN